MTVNELIKALQGIVVQDAQATVYEPEGDIWDKVVMVRIVDNGNEVQIIGDTALRLEND